MFNSKYSKLLTVILVLVILAILGLIIFLGYDLFRKYNIDKSAEEFVSNYENQVKNDVVIQNELIDNSVGDNTIIDVTNDIETNTGSNNNSGGSNSSSKYTYKGYNVVGTIEIPKTKIKYPILDNPSGPAIEVSVAMLYGPGPNQIGNTTIIGHNYRNGAFFGKNKQLQNGDTVYITDNSGQKIKYTIYNIYVTTGEDAEYMTRDTNGKREISLSTCTDDSKSRLVIWAKED